MEEFIDLEFVLKISKVLHELEQPVAYTCHSNKGPATAYPGAGSHWGG